MSKHHADVEALLPGSRRFTFADAGLTFPVVVAGEGPAVIVMAEMPGITPAVLAFAERVRALGCSVWLPVLFGEVGRPLGPAYLASSLRTACVAREFAAFATGKTAPVTRWLRALAHHAHAECGGPGVGAIGMCFTGGFALGMLLDESVIAPVLSQPSLPIGPGRRRAADLHLSPDDADAVAARVERDDLQVLGLRFSCDRLARAERFGSLRDLLGDRFIGVEIDSSRGNDAGIPLVAHSVLTEHLVDEAGHPTRDALDRVLAFLRDRLTAGPDRES